MNWLEVATMPDEKFLKLCRITKMLGSGKGGQKRNKTSNAVRINFDSYTSAASESRSAAINQTRALRKLKFQIVSDLTEERMKNPPAGRFLESLEAYIKGGSIAINPSNPNYPVFVGNVLDLFILHRTWHGVAKELNVSVSGLKKWLRKDYRLFDTARELTRAEEETKKHQQDSEEDVD